MSAACWRVNDVPLKAPLTGFVAELEKENKEREKEKVEPAAVTRQAKSKEEVAAKRRAIEAARDAYERDLAALIQKERKLFTERLNTLRESATNDIPNRFSAKFTELEREADTLVHRLEKWAERTLVDGSPVEEKISQGKLIGEKAIAKLQRLVNEAKEEVDDFGRAQHAKEQGAVQQAHHPVESLAQEAQSKLGIELTWLDGVTYADWQREQRPKDVSLNRLADSVLRRVPQARLRSFVVPRGASRNSTGLSSLRGCGPRRLLRVSARPQERHGPDSVFFRQATPRTRHGGLQHSQRRTDPVWYGPGRGRTTPEACKTGHGCLGDHCVYVGTSGRIGRSEGQAGIRGGRGRGWRRSRKGRRSAA